MLKALRPILLLFGGTFGSAIFSMGAQLLLARCLTVSDFGRMAAILAATNILSPIAGFGLNWFWVQSFGREGYGGFRWIRPSLRLLSITSVVSVAMLVAYVALATPIVSDRPAIILFAALILLGQSAIDIASTKFQLEERFGILALWQALPQLGRLLTASYLVIAARGSLENVLGGYAVMGTALTLLGIWACLQMLRRQMRLVGHEPKNVAANFNPSMIETARLSFPFAFITVFYLVYFQSSILLLNAFIGPKETALFSAALLMLAAVYLVPNIIFTKFLLGRVCRCTEHDTETLDAMLHLSVIGMVISGLLAAAFIAIVAPLAVPILFGQKYARAVEVLIWLAPTIPLRFIQSAYSGFLVSEADVRRRVRYAGISAGISLGLNLLLLPVIGIAGAVIASIASEGALMVLAAHGVAHHVNGIRFGDSFRPDRLRAAATRLLRSEVSRVRPA